ncbi:MAG: hypothetical protein AAFX81_15510 [Pseudomonadota bacterium]
MKSRTLPGGRSLVLIAAMAIPAGAVSGQDSPTFPDVLGTWVGDYRIAFPHDHPRFPDGAITVDHELEIYRQEGNLLWFETRWRWETGDEWVVEYGTGTFDAGDPTTMILTEAGPIPAPNAQTGLLFGTLRDDRLYLTYTGVGAGVTWSAPLTRQPN